MNTASVCPSCAAPFSPTKNQCDYCGIQVTVKGSSFAEPAAGFQATTSAVASGLAEVPDTPTHASVSSEIDVNYTPSQRGPVRFSTFWPAISCCVWKSFDFRGRASLGEFWWWTTAYIIVFLTLAAIEGETSSSLTGLLSILAFFAGTSVTIRRLHDVRISGWNYLWVFTGFGFFWICYVLLKPGDRGVNQWGIPSRL